MCALCHARFGTHRPDRDIKCDANLRNFGLIQDVEDSRFMSTINQNLDGYGYSQAPFDLLDTEFKRATDHRRVNH
jgi:hypothetical protein